MTTTLTGLSDGTALNQLAVALGGTGTGVTATADPSKGAVAGNYTLAVTNIATANKISSQAYASGASLGTGTLTVGVGSSSMQISVASTDSLSGVANNVTVSAGAGLDAGLNTASFTQVAAGKDATLSLDGNTITSASNTITSALTGVSIDISGASANSTQTISITNDTTASTKAINDF